MAKEGFLQNFFEYISQGKNDSFCGTGQGQQRLADILDRTDFDREESIKPIYNLQWDNKGVELLSPGERGQLLLIFYLLIDQATIPLIIDQPEENLDNQTVYQVLVPCIKEAKEKRQVILVTHNPNLAVVCDAEQIICVQMDKKNKNTITYVTGAIENPVINRKIVEILEGTEPAFRVRKSKYQFTGEQKRP